MSPRPALAPALGGGGEQLQSLVFPYQRSPDQDATGRVGHTTVIVGAGPVGLTLAIDLARMALLARSRKETGVLSHLSCFFKGPQGCTENDFFKQFIMLEEYVTTCRDC